MTRKAILALVGAFVIVVAASVGVTAFVMSRGEDTATVNQTPPTRGADGSGTGGTVSDSVCGLEPIGPAAKPTAGATSAKWQQIGSWWLPVSSLSGPIKRDEAGPWSCFSHDQSGAIIAGYVISMRASGVAEDWQSVTRQQTVPGIGQETHLSKGLEATSPSVLKGFEVAAYTKERATIRYYLHAAQLDGSCTMDVVWSSGDWKLQLGDDGSTATSCSQGIPQQFIPWGPS